MQITVSEDLAAAARLAELSEGEAHRAWIIGLFAEQRARVYNLPLLSRDGKIQQTYLVPIWTPQSAQTP